MRKTVNTTAHTAEVEAKVVAEGGKGTNSILQLQHLHSSS